MPKAIVLPLLLVLCGAALGASAYEGKLRTLSVSGFGTYRSTLFSTGVEHRRVMYLLIYSSQNI